MNQIKDNLDSITAILVLANGTVPGMTVGTERALSALAALLPETLAHTTALVLTNLSGPLYQNFAVPDVLNGAPQFSFNNPVALQRKFLTRTDGLTTRDKKMDARKREMRKLVKADERQALEMLVGLFDWLGGA